MQPRGLSLLTGVSPGVQNKSHGYGRTEMERSSMHLCLVEQLHPSRRGA